MYKEKTKIRYSHLGANGKTSLVSILNFFQDVATGHTSGTKYSMHNLYALNRAWILISMNTEVYRYPEIDEDITLITYPQSYERIYGNRCYEIRDAKDRVVAKCSSVWAFMDTETVRVTKVFPDFPELFECNTEHDLDFLRREPQVGEGEKVSEILVGKREIDTNRHVNNVKLVSFALEALPLDCEVKKAEIYYRSAVYEGEKINVLACKNGDSIGVKLCGENEDRARVTIKFYL